MARLLLVPALVLASAGAARASAYVNPFPSSSYTIGRTDMGVDVCLNAGDPIVAVGDGVVVGIQANWYAKQPYLWYQLTSGPLAGRYVYVAEQITHLAKVGTQLTAGQTIATFAKKGSCIETGWSAANGATLAQTTTGYHEGQATEAGVAFAHFLISLGVQGSFELTVPVAHVAAKKTKNGKPASKAKPTSKPTPTKPAKPKTATPAPTRPKPTTPTRPSRPKPATKTPPASTQPSGGSSEPPGPSGGATWSDGASQSTASASGGSGWS